MIIFTMLSVLIFFSFRNSNIIQERIREAFVNMTVQKQ
jgi:hypothetical protein